MTNKCFAFSQYLLCSEALVLLLEMVQLSLKLHGIRLHQHQRHSRADQTRPSL